MPFLRTGIVNYGSHNLDGFSFPRSKGQASGYGDRCVRKSTCETSGMVIGVTGSRPAKHRVWCTMKVHNEGATTKVHNEGATTGRVRSGHTDTWSSER